MKRFPRSGRSRARRGAVAARAGAAPGEAARAARARRQDAGAAVLQSLAAHAGLVPGGHGAPRRQLLRHHPGPGHLAAGDARGRRSWTARPRSTCARRSRCSPPTATRSASAPSPRARDLAADLAETTFNAMAACVDKPLINLESAVNHPCQALADWKTLDDLAVPRAAKFVLSWAYHPRALPLAVPAAARAHGGAARHGSRSCCGRKASRCRAPIMEKARRAAAASGGSVRETSDRDEALERRARRSTRRSGAATAHYGDAAADARLRARAHRLVRARGLVRARAPRLPTHALPAGAAQCRGRRRGARRPAQRRAARGLQPPGRADGGAAPPARNADMSTSTDAIMIMHRADQTLAIRALRSAAPYIRMYKGKTFVVKAGGGVFADAAATRVLIEQIAILHYFGVRVVLVHGGGPQLTELADALGVADAHGARAGASPTRSPSTSPRMVLNGLINTQRARHLPRARHRRGRRERRGRRAGARAQAPAGAGRRPARRSTTASSATSTRVDTSGAQEAARQRPHAGREPAVGRRAAARCSTSTPTRWRPPSARRWRPRSSSCAPARPASSSELDDPRLAHLLHRSAGPEAAARGGQHRRRHAAQGQGHRGCDPRRRAARARDVVPARRKASSAEVFTNEGTGTLIVADINALTPAEQQSG